MTKSSVPPNAPVTLPTLLAAYVEATNSFDLKRLLRGSRCNAPEHLITLPDHITKNGLEHTFPYGMFVEGILNRLSNVGANSTFLRTVAMSEAFQRLPIPVGARLESLRKAVRHPGLDAP